MTISRVVFFLPNLDGGGAEKVAISLAKEFTLKEIKTEFLVFSKTGEYSNSVAKHFGITELQTNISLKTLLLFFRFMRQLNNAVVFSFLPLPNIFLGFYSFLNKNRLILIGSERSDNSFALPNYNKFLKFIIIRISQFFYQQLDGIVCISDTIYEILTKNRKISRNKIKVIYNPIMELTQGNSFVLSEAPIWPQKVLRFLSVGRLSEEKNHQLQLEFIKEISSEYDCHLIIVGKGSLLPSLLAKVELLGLANHVSFYGFVNDLTQFYDSAHFFLHTAIFEGFGNSILEALSFGKVIIATNTSGANLILQNGEYGYLAEDFSVKSLVDCFKKAVNTPLNKDTLVSRANYFSLERCVSNHLDFFNYIEGLLK